VITLLLLLRPGTASARNGMEDIGSSLAQSSRGGAFIATEPNSGALFGNPAALGFLEFPDFQLDFREITPRLGYSGALQPKSSLQQYLIPSLSYARPGDLAWGAGIYNLGGMGAVYTDYDLSALGVPAGLREKTSSRFSYTVGTLSVAGRLTDDTAVGLGYAYGRATGKYSSFPSSIGQRVDGLSGWGGFWQAGIYHRASADTTLGAYYRSGTDLELTGGTLTFGPLATQAGVVLEDISLTGFDFPEQYGIGIGQRFDEEWKGYVEYRRLLWSDAMESIDVVLPTGPAPQALNWTDQDVYVLGAEYQPNGEDCETYRFGLNYGKSPVPDATVLFAAGSEMHFTAGYERQVDEELSLVTGLVYSPANFQTSAPDSPHNPIYGGGRPFETSTEIWQFGIGLHWKLEQPQSGQCDACEGCAAGDFCEDHDPAPSCRSAEADCCRYAALHQQQPQHESHE